MGATDEPPGNISVVDKFQRPKSRPAARKAPPATPAHSMSPGWPWVIGIAAVALAMADLFIAPALGRSFIWTYVIPFLPRVAP